MVESLSPLKMYMKTNSFDVIRYRVAIRESCLALSTLVFRIVMIQSGQYKEATRALLRIIPMIMKERNFEQNDIATHKFSINTKLGGVSL